MQRPELQTGGQVSRAFQRSTEREACVYPDAARSGASLCVTGAAPRIPIGTPARFASSIRSDSVALRSVRLSNALATSRGHCAAIVCAAFERATEKRGGAAEAGLRPPRGA